MLRDKPPVDDPAIAACLERDYGLAAVAVTFLPLGYDPNAAVYRVDAQDSTYFLKLTRSAIAPASLQIPRAIIDHGIGNVLAPLQTLRNELWCACGVDRAILYPFIAGENAKKRGMSGEQWHTFGTTLDAIHSSGIAAQFANDIPTESFVAPAIDLVRAMQAQIEATQCDMPIQQEFAAFWQEHASLIRHLTERAEQLGSVLRTQNLPTVLCHGDIHAANIMLGENDKLYLVDWDTPRIAPRERDLLFVIGSPIARRVTPHEEALFFAGYGPIATNWHALTYYRYERALEDIYEGGRSVFFNPLSSVAVKAANARLTMSLFGPDDIVAVAMAGDEQLEL